MSSYIKTYLFDPRRDYYENIADEYDNFDINDIPNSGHYPIQLIEEDGTEPLYFIYHEGHRMQVSSLDVYDWIQVEKEKSLKLKKIMNLLSRNQ